MAKDFPYFKFFVSEWNDGDITLESLECQGLFINICSYYWSNECDLTLEKLLKKFRHFDQSLIKSLFDCGAMKDDNGYLRINFLNEQRQERMRLSEQNAKNVRKRYDRNTNVKKSYNENPTIKRREEKKREEKRIVKTPTLNEVKDYFKEKGYTEESAVKAFEYYDSNDWKDSNGKKVKSWKQKMIAVWHKPENKIKPKNNAHLFRS